MLEQQRFVSYKTLVHSGLLDDVPEEEYEEFITESYRINRSHENAATAINLVHLTKLAKQDPYFSGPIQKIEDWAKENKSTVELIFKIAKVFGR